MTADAAVLLMQVKDATGAPVQPPSVVPPESVPVAATTGAAQPPAPEGSQNADFVRRRLLVFAGIVIG